MRLWSLHPKYLDPRGLVALWREALLARAVLRGETRGYTLHPQLQRFKAHAHPLLAIDAYLAAVHVEASSRGYAFDRSKFTAPGDAVQCIPVGSGQLAFEWSHLRQKLVTRNPEWLARLGEVGAPDCHPLLRRRPGPVASWERAAGGADPPPRPDHATVSDTPPQTVELWRLDPADLRRLAASEAVDLPAMTIPEGALPPAHVAARALARLESGTPPLWCVPFLILAGSRTAVVGSCMFKGAPAKGVVEIGYGVASSQRGRGVATAAVGQLLRIAAASGIVRTVVAHIVPGNLASAGVVSRLGFSKGRPLVDPDGETVVGWTRRVVP